MSIDWVSLIGPLGFAFSVRASMTPYDIFIERCERERQERMRIESNRRRTNATRRYRAWAKYELIGD